MLIRPPRAVIALLLASLVTLVGCKASAVVAVNVQPDGSGTVTVTATLDAEAVARIGGDLTTTIKLDDLRASGWNVTGPTTSGSDTVITATKPFGSADRLGAVLAELGGPDGPFPDWKLTTSNSFAESTYEITGRVRLTGSLDQFSDAEVAAALDGFALGRSPEELAADLEANPGALSLGVAVAMPGQMDEVAGLTRDNGGAAAVGTFVLGNDSAIDQSITVRSSATDRSPVLWVIVGLGLMVAAIVLFVAGRRQAQRRRRRSTSAG